MASSSIKHIDWSKLSAWQEFNDHINSYAAANGLSHCLNLLLYEHLLEKPEFVDVEDVSIAQQQKLDALAALVPPAPQAQIQDLKEKFILQNNQRLHVQYVADNKTYNDNYKSLTADFYKLNGHLYDLLGTNSEAAHLILPFKSDLNNMAWDIWNQSYEALKVRYAPNSVS